MTTTGRARGKAIVFGIAFWYPLAGVTFQFLHYLLGLRRLGWDVYYVEDCGRWVYDPMKGQISDDASPNVAAVAPVLEHHGFGERWAFHGSYPGGRTYGMSESELRRLYREADMMLNVTGSHVMRDEHLVCPLRVYVQSDPPATQILAARGHSFSVDQLDAHNAHFTFGEQIGAPGCPVPVGRWDWLPTRQPVALELWDGNPVGGPRYTTVTTWRNNTEPLEWDGELYWWTKDREFMKVLDLPRRSTASFELAVDLHDPGVDEMLQRRGWSIRPAVEVSESLESYRSFILGSRGEFTVARDQVVRPKPGWFSDRSACYLAAGRPVITQDTGFGSILPTGEGLFAWRGMDDILAAVEAVEVDYASQCAAARELADEYFSADAVLESLLRRAGA